MAKTYKKLRQKQKQKQRQTRRQTRRQRQRRGGASITNVPSILLVPYRHSSEECIKKMIEATPPNELTLKQNSAILNTYAMLLLTRPNSTNIQSKMRPDVKTFIDDINKRRLLEYKKMHSNSKNMPPSVKGDLRQLNASYVAEILSPNVNKNATIQDIIDWLTK
jgi:hypothetical protein